MGEVSGSDGVAWPLVDLFGDPVPVNRGKKGRPQHVPTAENRAFVTMMLAVGEKVDTIAIGLGITLPTLRKHYFSELLGVEAARARVRGKMLVAIAAEALKGNSGSAKALLERLDRAEARERAGVQQRAEPRAPTLGKKEAERRAAFNAGAGSTWDEVLTQH